ncbi:predicted protein [Naegleria gruberi]|uniref:Predicted protein n=1 Tax=Naegleria gruberi TaxID=5762 RepID=D2VMH8_NAEGR|nr:uncharacterized protein NAEGRDRAFT_50776 [Naegleria gruberi]EFC42063.1 predicted protein [Naegleria gruberi]|eukprot:XP_002674807.1 predicted protein [Naegleria gruberi strain NEG-M]
MQQPLSSPSPGTIDEEKPQFHPIACNNCKRLHKCCDRALPSCSGCKWRKVECVYEEAKKGASRIRKKKKSNNDGKITFQMENSSFNETCNNLISINNLTINSGSIITNSSIGGNGSNISAGVGVGGNLYQTINEFAEMRKYLDIYEEMMSEIWVINPKELETYLLSKDDSLPNCKEVKAMFMAIKAQIEQETLASPTADESARKARDALSKIFDEHSNFYVASAYAYLACYEIGCGKLKTARFYLKFVEFYLDENPIDDLKATKYQINLKKFKQVLTCEAKSENTAMGMLKDWHEIAEKHIGVKFPKEWSMILDQKLTESTYVIFIQMLDAVISICKGMMMKNQRVSGTLNDIAEIVGNGLKIRIYTEMNRGKDKIEECALKITTTTESGQLSFSPSFLIAPIAAACKIHLQIVKLIEKGDRKNCDVSSPLGAIDYYQVLSKDLRALQILSKRYKGVQLFHHNMIKEIETIIERKQFYNALNECITNQSFSPPTVDLSKIESANEFFQYISNLNDLTPTTEREDENLVQHRMKEYEESLNSFLDSFSAGSEVETDLEPFLDSTEIQELFNMNYGLSSK